jgi:hypothetical protein
MFSQPIWIHLFVCLLLSVSETIFKARSLWKTAGRPWATASKENFSLITTNEVLFSFSLSFLQRGNHAEGNFESRYRKFSLRFLSSFGKSFNIQFSCFVSCINLFLLFHFQKDLEKISLAKEKEGENRECDSRKQTNWINFIGFSKSFYCRGEATRNWSQLEELSMSLGSGIQAKN